MMISLRQLVTLSFVVNGAFLLLILYSGTDSASQTVDEVVQEELSTQKEPLPPQRIPPMPKPITQSIAEVTPPLPALPKPHAAPLAKTHQPDGAVYYTLKNGDNPWKISRQQKIKFSDLLKLNNLDESKAKQLKPGDKIRIR